MFVVLQVYNKLIGLVGAFAAVVSVALLVHYTVSAVLTRVAKRATSHIDESLVRHFRSPVRWIMN